MSTNPLPVQQNVPRKVLTNNSLPILYIDGVRVASRTDGMFLIRLTTDVPDGHVEQIRVMIDSNHLKRIIDSMCRASSYYPKKLYGTKASSKK